MVRNLILAASLLLLLCCKKESSGNQSLPEFSTAKSISISEDVLSGKASINLGATTNVGKDVKVIYSTSDSSAKTGIDYQGIQSGQLTIPAGQNYGIIQIRIYSDTLQKQDLVFKVHIDSIINGTLENRDIRVTISNVDYSKLVWSDEFTDSIINTSNWNFEQGNNNGWGNNELEVYTNSPDNAFISGGSLVIKASGSPGSYKSARMTTQSKRTFVQGRIDIRAKLPQGQGVWPALWMLGSNITSVNWPACGEIDIMELLGHEPAKMYGTVHYDNGGHLSKGSFYLLNAGTFSESYHKFSVIWQPHHLKWLVDDHEYYSVTDAQISGFSFNLPQFFIFNIAVGGNWPGNPDNSTVFPQTMAVDYIRVYQ